MGESERTKIKQEVREFVTQNGNFEFHEVNLEDLYHPGNLQETKTTIHVDETEDYTSTATIQKLKRCFDSLMSLTAKEDLLKSMKQQLLIKVAIKEGYPKVMMGDSSSRISVRILSNISQGRGEALSFDTGFVDSRHGEVTILRPMREFVAKEIFLYNFFQGIEAISIPTLATKSNCYASIDRLTEEFISGLQVQFPFTINTIFRTGDKLTLKDNSVSGYHCSLCGVPLVQSEQGKLTTKLEQIKLENCQETENHKADARDGDFKDCCGSSSSGSAGEHTCISQKKNARAVSKDEVTKTLCYGCSLTLKDMKAEYEALPSFVTESTSKQFNQAQMKEQIDEFLLED
jgi:cytoplasmic tRNA 2-thiolation protein 2